MVIGTLIGVLLIVLPVVAIVRLTRS